jgi:ribonuclease P/MRP protein subunit RPP40
MLDFTASTKNEARCSVTHGVMGHLDPNQPPVKRKPFAAILNHNFVQKVSLILSGIRHIANSCCVV